jgi:hypothetical protein
LNLEPDIQLSQSGFRMGVTCFNKI